LRLDWLDDLSGQWLLLGCNRLEVKDDNASTARERFPRSGLCSVARFFFVHDTKTGKMYQMNAKCKKTPQSPPSPKKKIEAIF
jgi:hypothetical protein